MGRISVIQRLTKTLVDIMFIIGIPCCIAVPFVMPFLTDTFGYGSETVLPFSVVLILAGICALYILMQLKLMYRSLIKGNPFITKNIICLKKCAIASLVVSATFFVKIFFWFSITTFAMIIAFALLGLFCLTLKDLFKQAVAFKEENEWTI